ncbi:hypothetical protein BCR44DRAFT_1501002 [Catenaria anguillulae PL171]|uniref:Cyanocobalamin reductase (cyanide-eliminating) n=1 Tax=Catenaria anguillulae PL171 TaxID=765915 RepID=A0A1Y2HGY6_9FUNG|nr:hypothetical protein BCR44DRAFT_1501002 [Catenaria anguillulae PL171]
MTTNERRERPDARFRLIPLGLLRSRGFDLSAAFPVQAYNLAVPPNFHLPTYSCTASTLGILVANSKALWPKFCTFIRAQPAFIQSTPNPFDAFVTLQVDECIALARAQAHVPAAAQHDVRHYWEMTPGRMVAIQRMCQVAGVAYLDQACHLNVHTEYGPWLALRYAIVIDLPGPDPASIPTLTNPIPASLQPHIHHAISQLLAPGTSYHTRPVPTTTSTRRHPCLHHGTGSHAPW